jgi:ectoine hydroxylase-related dioxygenase (phytanoyl-CoA dioxygenase family)
MDDDDRYLFDLNGYIIVRNVLSKDDVERANDIITKRMDQTVERSEASLRNTVKGTAFSGSANRKDLGGVLEWGSESQIFRSMLAHPKLLPYFHTLLGKGYRMDHMPFCIIQGKNSEGFQLHGGTIDCTSGKYNPHLAYSYNHGVAQCALLGCNLILVDHNAGDGGFCVVPGSHKSNYKMPKGMVDGERYSEYIVQPETKAGDVILFSEGTVHGAKAWVSDHERRTCLYRFGPATHAYGRSYFGHEGGGWPPAMYDGLTEVERAVLEPPYASRLDRPTITDDGGHIEIVTRSSQKKEHDRAVFQTKYF